jgi:hypothetical protein
MLNWIVQAWIIVRNIRAVNAAASGDEQNAASKLRKRLAKRKIDFLSDAVERNSNADHHLALKQACL